MGRRQPAPLLRSLVRDPTPPDSDWIRRYLLQQSWHHTCTAYSEISRLASGHTLTIRAGAAPVLRRWFAWRDAAPAADRRDERWVALYREALDRAVRRRWDGDAPVASENSAGIDSAAITAVLARQIPDVAGRLVSVGVAHFDTESLDILGLSRALGLRHNHVLTQLDANADATEIRNVLRVLGHPEENGAGTGMTPLHEICRLMGVRHLFSGFGGDEAASHSAYHLRRELLDRRQHRALFDILPGNAAARALRFGRAVWTGLPTMQQGLLHRQETGTPLPFLSRFIPAAEIERLGIESDALATLRAREGCRSVNASVIGPELGSPHVASRLESCTLVAAMRGLQVTLALAGRRIDRAVPQHARHREGRAPRHGSLPAQARDGPAYSRPHHLARQEGHRPDGQRGTPGSGGAVRWRRARQAPGGRVASAARGNRRSELIAQDGRARAWPAPCRRAMR